MLENAIFSHYPQPAAPMALISTVDRDLLPSRARREKITESEILAMADAHFAKHGVWPNVNSGRVSEGSEDTWSALDQSLRHKTRGLPGGSSISRLIAANRYVDRKAITEAEILALADAHFAAYGVWPTAHSGRVSNVSDENWSALDQCLRLGLRSLSGGSSVARLIAANRDTHRIRIRKEITIERISDWTDSHRRRTGEWPTTVTGAILEAPGKTWIQIDRILRRGAEGCREPTSLARHLESTRGVPIFGVRTPLTEEQILAWADAHYHKTRSWPKRNSGEVLGAPGELWHRVDTALQGGFRSLPKAGSLAKLLAAHRGRRHKVLLPPIDIEAVNAWVLKHYLRHGRLPRVTDGKIEGSSGETWGGLDQAFGVGNRGLSVSGCRSLKEFFNKRFPRPEFVRYTRVRPVLSYSSILAWADAHHARTGAWPNRNSGEIPEAPGENWARVCHCMVRANRGLPMAMSMAALLEQKRGVRHPHHRKLTIERILMWADAHFARRRSWPGKSDASPIPESPDDTWKLIDSALTAGSRGLPKSGSLAILLLERRGRRHKKKQPPLNLDDLEVWARNYVTRHGHWPSHHYGGRVEEAPEEAWRAIYDAFKHGRRGLLFSGYTSLTDFLKDRLGSPSGIGPALQSWHSYEVRRPKAPPKRSPGRRR
jgi:hypothetical protein